MCLTFEKSDKFSYLLDNILLWVLAQEPGRSAVGSQYLIKPNNQSQHFPEVNEHFCK